MVESRKGMLVDIAEQGLEEVLTAYKEEKMSFERVLIKMSHKMDQAYDMGAEDAILQAK